MSLVAQRVGAPAVVADLLALPDQGHGYEIVDGELVQKESSPKHGGAQLRFGAVLRAYNRRPGGRLPGGWIFAAEVLIDLGDKQIFRPDVAGWRRERLPALPAEPALQVLPDWVCEILSPSNASNDLVKKKRVYHQRHVPHYWIIDPVGETMTVHRWSPEGYVEVLSALSGERVRAEPFDAIEMNVGVFFGEDEDE